jgi:putative lipoprotein
MIAALTLALTLSAASPAPPKDAWFGADKVKHFLMSALVQSTAFSISRMSGGSRTLNQTVGGAATIIVGFGKEVHDRRVGKPFSFRDLVWDGLGALAAAALLNGTR